MSRILYKTFSYCPECLKEIKTDIKDCDDRVIMEKSCVDHGTVRTIIWEDTAASYLAWIKKGGLDWESFPKTEEELKKCRHYSCHMDPYNGARPVTAALMVTALCNLSCPVCFTKSVKVKHTEPSFSELCNAIDTYREAEGEGAPLEFCGGEPTVRDDLPELANYARSVGFDYIQLNTNGLKPAEDSSYCKILKASGITTIYLGFDGMNDNVYKVKYGRNMLDVKERAVFNAAEAGLSVVLVPCIMDGVNDRQLGEIVRYAKENMPAIKGVYFQPISYFGKYPAGEKKRITIPRIIRFITEQTGGEIEPDSFLPGNCEHPLCSFQGIFRKNAEGSLVSTTIAGAKKREKEDFKRVRKNAKYLWGPSNRKFLTIGGMAFQDVWNYDSFRTEACTIQIIGKQGGLVPLCAKYLTDRSGRRIPAADI